MTSATAAERVAFPSQRPEGACYPRPRANETLDISPPGFCWWPAGKRGAVRYRLKVAAQDGGVAYESPVIEDPAHLPTNVLPAGRYTWTVEALDKSGKVLATRAPEKFTISDGAIGQPWVSAEELLSRVPREHPRLLFPKATLAEVRATLGTTRQEPFATLKRSADAGLKLKPPKEPDYDKIKDSAALQRSRRAGLGEPAEDQRRRAGRHQRVARHHSA
ncbi:MAG: hypothetical protein FJ388_13225, partial [Verrucomicrobia bacterium]|nr:hypothetical protein [Verrucomicrobiota bacterium]